MSADRTKRIPSIDKSTTKLKAQKGKTPSRRQQNNHSQKNIARWKIVNAKPFGSSPPLQIGSKMSGFPSLAMDFKGFHAGCSVEPIPTLSDIATQSSAEG